MNRKKWFIVGGVPATLFVVINVINIFIYPLTPERPYFADVERVFNKIQIPSDWKVIETYENRGIAGRACPIEGSGCFSKGVALEVPAGVDNELVLSVFKSSGCAQASIKRNEVIGGAPYSNIECGTEGLRVSGTLSEDADMWRLSVYVSTQ